MPNVVTVAIALVFDAPHERILICQRKADAVLGGYWEFPGGKCEPDEPVVACALRELREEVAVEAAAVATLPMIAHDYPHASVRLHPILCTHTAGEAQPLEVTQLRWIPPAELADYRFPEANADLVRRAAQGFTALRAAATPIA